MKHPIFISILIHVVFISGCSSIYQSKTKKTEPYDSIKEIINDLYCFDTSFGCEVQESFSMLIDSINKIDSSFLNSKNFYFLYDSKDNSPYNFHSLISNDIQGYSLFSLSLYYRDSNKIEHLKDSINFSEGVSKYWKSTIKKNWGMTMDSIAGKWESYDDAPWSIGISIKSFGRNKYAIKNAFGQ